jgi:hypothetical protein
VQIVNALLSQKNSDIGTNASLFFKILFGCFAAVAFALLSLKCCSLLAFALCLIFSFCGCYLAGGGAGRFADFCAHTSGDTNLSCEVTEPRTLWSSPSGS